MILGLLVGVLAILCFGHLPGARKHEKGNSPSTFRIAPFDERSKAFVLEREANWFSVEHDNFALSDLMRAAGQVPSVRSLTHALTSSTTEYHRWKLYRWLYPRRALLVDALANITEGYLELATLYNTNANPTLLVSDDGHLALLWTRTNAVIVFQDGTNGLHESQYREKANGSHSVGLSTEGSLVPLHDKY